MLITKPASREAALALDQLDAAIVAAYRKHEIARAEEATELSEQARRWNTLEGINEILALVPTVSITHLEFLEALLFAWRELTTVACGFVSKDGVLAEWYEPDEGA